MKTHYDNWLFHKDENHIITLILDKPETSTNVLSHSVLDELQVILNEIKSSQSNALIFKSAKPDSFIAGADVNEFSQFQSNTDPYNDALHIVQKGQHVMNCIENLPFPTFALINGYCLGGGMELALACDYRIALDHEKTRLGLPEIKLGIHPGFGGTIRTIQLMGVFKSMNLMLSGRIISAASAKKMGLVDEVVAQRHFDKSVLQWLENDTFLKKITAQQKRPFYYSLLENDVTRPIVAYIIESNIKKRVKKKHYPAPYELINLWNQYGGNHDFMMKKEAESVASLITSEAAQNLIRVYHLQNQLKSLSHVKINSIDNFDKKPPSLHHIHIIGGGVMGGDIAIWCAYKGFTVTVHDRSNEMLARVIQRADTFLKKKVKNTRLIQSIMDRLIPDLKNHGLKKPI
ncbi:MAG: enoyl-CoA hydratase/isomerase family protein [gamma proteobacterium symbiont of Bathyaustriella thionipta]|nr:enoyl-CoA hydratase/isomerase family protein [gamma proteobacterium symbiont of Bathyaustriella thionipta]MCU7950752.1 enoyl-CoA hydratase/isomerase family protein [gamma proteobacterium symbiont of Bathyaustriella thionipta]MCU7952842.1 enoyl-CoA hydratase/isomerase family protein [gamma proteobacterium symbiont of Bathyaustriella thionipta]MCU7957243.1 enoyl-CoA hydratase/isomerase family protein [gamma proteobacterium symbiont of Bathyaustriella thionipta]MCU7967969.1 enoyl-CoA hydratase/